MLGAARGVGRPLGKHESMPPERIRVRVLRRECLLQELRVPLGGDDVLHDVPDRS